MASARESLSKSLRKSLRKSLGSASACSESTRVSQTSEEDDEDESGDYQYGEEQRKQGLRAAQVLATLNFRPVRPTEVLRAGGEDVESMAQFDYDLDRIRSLRRKKHAAADHVDGEGVAVLDDFEAHSTASPSPAKRGNRPGGVILRLKSSLGRSGKKRAEQELQANARDAGEARRVSF